jgi:polyvinyl alcohol dehydrogenase (cytochrome)
MALNARAGKVLWRTYTVPAGYTGGAVWGSQPVVDHQTGLLYVGTGNNYSSPPGVCVSSGQRNCTPRDPADHMDSIVGMSLQTGKIKWSKATLYADTWTIPMPNDSPDFDFGPGRSSTRPPSTDIRPSCWASATGPDMYALNGTTGQILWRYASGGAVWAGAAIANGTVYWGTGYHTEDFGLGCNGDSNKLYAFTRNGH